MLDIDSFSNAIALIYEASIDVDRWSDALAFFCTSFAARKGQISFATSLHDTDVVFRFHGITEADLKVLPKYRELIPHDPRMSTISFKAIHCRQATTDETLHASRMYKEVLAPVGIEYAMWFDIALSERAHAVVSLMRGPLDLPFTEQDCSEFSRFVPHVQRAVTIHGTFQRAREEIAVARAVMDTMPLGVLVMDEGDMVLANREARSLLAEGVALKYDNGALRTKNQDANAKLAAAIRDARRWGSERPIGLSLPVGPTDQVRAVIRPLRTSPATILGVRDGSIAVYLSDSRKPIETPEEILQQLFGLTGREAAVLQALVQGDSLAEIAKRFQIGLQTVKTHIQHIMQATRARRQAELVKLVLSSPAWIAAQKLSERRRGAGRSLPTK
jgi:DNA-binding CsgD family transcriptional regulator/PAS domain-containing protein